MQPSFMPRTISKLSCVNIVLFLMFMSLNWQVGMVIFPALMVQVVALMVEVAGAGAAAAAEDHAFFGDHRLRQASRKKCIVICP